jgi:hypothetical protein
MKTQPDSTGELTMVLEIPFDLASETSGLKKPHQVVIAVEMAKTTYS